MALIYYWWCDVVCCFWFLFLARIGFLLFHSHPMTWVFLCRLAPHASVCVCILDTLAHHTDTHTQLHSRAHTHNLVGGNGNQQKRVFAFLVSLRENEIRLWLLLAVRRFGSDLSLVFCATFFSRTWVDECVHMRISCY